MKLRLKSIIGVMLAGAAAMFVGCAAPPSNEPGSGGNPPSNEPGSVGKAPTRKARSSKPEPRADTQAARPRAQPTATSQAGAGQAQSSAAAPAALSGFFSSPNHAEPYGAATQPYSRKSLDNFQSRIITGATALDFDASMSMVASCSQNGRGAQLDIEGVVLALNGPPPTPAWLPCISVALSPDRSYVAVTYGKHNQTIAHSTAVFAISRDNGQAIATLVQFAPGASSVDFSDDSSRALFGSMYLTMDLGRPGNYVRLVDLREGKELFHTITRVPKLLNRSSNVLGARFTSAANGAMVLLESASRWTWVDLDLSTGQLSGNRPMSSRLSDPAFAAAPDRSKIAALTENHKLNVILAQDGSNVPIGSQARMVLRADFNQSEKSNKGLFGDIRLVAFSNSGRTVATCRESGEGAKLSLWSVAAAKMTGERDYPDARCSEAGAQTFRFAPDDRDILISKRTGGLQWVPSPGFVDADYDRVAAIVDGGDMKAIKREFDTAKSAESKKLIEALLVKKYLGKLLIIHHTTRGLDGKAFGGVGNGGALSQIAAMLGGYKVGTESTVEIEYDLQLDPAIFKLNHTYAFTAGVVLTAMGEGYYETNCMWPLPKKCRNEMNSARFSTAISGVLVRNQPTAGRTSIKWYPKFESESLGGLVKSFAADSIKVSIDGVKVEVTE